jgi:hypothetical protein
VGSPAVPLRQLGVKRSKSFSPVGWSKPMPWSVTSMSVLVVPAVDVDFHLRTSVGELNGIGDQVLQYLLKQFRLYFHSTGVMEVGGQRNALVVGGRRQCMDGILHQFFEGYGRQLLVLLEQVIDADLQDVLQYLLLLSSGFFMV